MQLDLPILSGWT